jgi:PTS system N-acetylglucosamine-specific IIC component
MFVAPVLYVIHAVLTGLSLAIAAYFQWTAGFGFSAGLIDFILSSRLPLANQPWMLLVQGLGFAVVYYALFRFTIVKFNLMTPGREEENDEEKVPEDAENAQDRSKYTAMAAMIYDGLGGDRNVVSIENCVTRLRVEVKNMAQVDQTKIKRTGIPGINVVSNHNIQVIIGPHVQFVADEIEKIRSR